MFTCATLKLELRLNPLQIATEVGRALSTPSSPESSRYIKGESTFGATTTATGATLAIPAAIKASVFDDHHSAASLVSGKDGADVVTDVDTNDATNTGESHKVNTVEVAATGHIYPLLQRHSFDHRI